jgi:hypothetical protein
MTESSISPALLYRLDLTAIALFAISYHRNCYRRGYRIDFWHAELFLLCVFPNMIMLPFALSELNLIVLGRDLHAVMAAVPTVFLVTLLGYFAILLGGTFWRFRAGFATAQVLDIVPRWSRMLMSSRTVLVGQAGLCMVLQFLILALYFSANGFAFDLRSYTSRIQPYARSLLSFPTIQLCSHPIAWLAMSTRRKKFFCCARSR